MFVLVVKIIAVVLIIRIQCFWADSTFIGYLRSNLIYVNLHE
jgi:hypothetical protein